MLKRHNIDKMHMLNQQDRQNMKSNQASYMMHTHTLYISQHTLNSLIHIKSENTSKNKACMTIKISNKFVINWHLL